MIYILFHLEVILRRSSDIEGTAIPFISDFLYDLICQSTSVDDQESPLFSVYPNPCQNYINIENLNRINNVVIVDLLGNIVSEITAKYLA